MNKFEVQISQWRQQMHSAGRLHSGEVEELESHLRESVDHLVESGLDNEEAFLVATHRLGSCKTLGAAYDENRSVIERLVRPSRLVATLVLIIVLLATGWVMWTSYSVCLGKRIG